MAREQTGTSPVDDADTLTMLEVKAGNTASLDLLVVKHRRRILRHVYLIVHDPAACEELTQETFLRVFRHRADYEPTARFTTWILTIAGRLALNWRRDSLRRRIEPLETQPSGAYFHLRDPAAGPLDRLMIQRRRHAVREAVALLPERQRSVVLLHKFEGYSCEEIAAALGCSNQAVRSLLVRAYTSLRTHLAQVD